MNCTRGGGFSCSLARCICDEVKDDIRTHCPWWFIFYFLSPKFCYSQFFNTFVTFFCVVKSDTGFTELFVFTTFRNCNHLFLCPWLHTTVVLKYSYIKPSFFWSVNRECRSILFLFRCLYRGYWHPNSFYSLHSMDSNMCIVTGLIQLLVAVEILLYSKIH